MTKILILLVVVLCVAPVPGNYAGSESSVSPRLNEILATGALRQLYVAQMTYKNGTGNGSFTDLRTLYNEGLIDAQLAEGNKFGFFYNFTWTPANHINPPKININAVPMIFPKTGRRSFAVNERCQLRGSDNGGGQSPSGDPIVLDCPYLNVDFSVNEAILILAMATLYEAEVEYRKRFGTYGILSQLSQAGLINPALGSGTANYYTFAVFTLSPNEGFDGFFRIWAQPVGYGVGGLRSFYVEKDDVIRGADHGGDMANQDDPPVGSPLNQVMDLSKRRADRPSQIRLPGVFRTGFEQDRDFRF